jgi:hypothetical protein
MAQDHVDLDTTLADLVEGLDVFAMIRLQLRLGELIPQRMADHLAHARDVVVEPVRLAEPSGGGRCGRGP